LGEEDDFVAGGVGVGGGGGHEDAHDDVAQVGDGAEELHHQGEGADDLGLKGLAVGDADVFGDDLGEDEDRDGHDGGENAEPGVAEEFEGETADQDGAEGVGYRVEREDRGDRLFEAELEVFEELAFAGVVAFEGFDFADGRAEDEGLHE